MRRRICVITGTRAEYGLLRGLLEELRGDARIDLQLVVTGAHLVRSLGATAEEITADGFVIDRTVDLELSDSSALGVARSLGLGVTRIAQALADLHPDVVVVLGDRYEVLASAQAALLSTIPVAHLHGGETTEGAIDEAIRHAVTKMSHLHFVAADDYRRRVIQLGEHPDRVFNVGAFGLDGIDDVQPPASELTDFLDFDLEAPFLLVTYHPVTLEPELVETRVDALVGALDDLEARCVITKANADPGGQLVNRRLEQYAGERRSRVRLVASLGRDRYVGVMRKAAAVVGNSSSGIIEAPALGVPTVNIGDRQRGRLRAAGVIDVPEQAEAIAGAVRTATSPRFREQARTAESLYGRGGASAATARILVEQDLRAVVKKRFHDVRFS